MQPHKLAPIRKRYIIYGAGAIGSAIGAMLARGGNAVTLVGRHRHMKAIREEGLRIDGLLGEYRVENLSAVEKIEDLDLIDLPDYLLLCVKSFDTTGAAREISSSGLVGKNTFVVSLQKALLGLMEEAFSVAQGEGSAQFQSFEEYLDLFFGKLLPATVAHNSSMLQDIRKGRATEIESINGEVIKRGKAMGIDTPYNETVYNLVKAKVALHGSGTGND